MSAALPPVPDLIPISVLRKGSQRSSSAGSSSGSSSTNSEFGLTNVGSNSGYVDNHHQQQLDEEDFADEEEEEEDEEEDDDEAAAAAAAATAGGGEVMGEQRSRRTKHAVAAAAAAEVIDTPPRWSRGRHGAAPGASRKTERHRKSDRRRDRDRHRARRKRSGSSKQLNASSTTTTTTITTTTNNNNNSTTPSIVVASATCSTSPPTTAAASPRVNPIFVWVRQQDTHIVEVKCEDYDKRNRILLTKTAQGWRAIPRTETLAPVLHKDDAGGGGGGAGGGRSGVKKAKKRSKTAKRKSFGVQVDEDDLLVVVGEDAWSGDDSEVVAHESSSLPSTPPQNDEDNRECAGDEGDDDDEEDDDDNDVQNECAANNNNNNNSNKNNISPLDNLLAVAELEFNQQIEAERWETSNNSSNSSSSSSSGRSSSKTNVQEDLDMFIESCNAAAPADDKRKTQEDDCECDYNEEDDNNIGMDDILSRLEQSLRSPDSLHNDIDMIIKEDLDSLQADAPKSGDSLPDVGELQPEMNNVTDEITSPVAVEKEAPETSRMLPVDVEDAISASVIGLVAEELTTEEVSKQSSVEGERNENRESDGDVDSQPTDLSIQATQSTCEHSEDLTPTDLSIPKCPISPLSKRPPSQNSETIQSPQPSGIPAVPPSPDLLYSANKNNSKSNIYLESLLSPAKTDSVVLTAEKEPLNLGKMRESDSPRVTCSQEEPPSKKLKLEDITLKTLLDKQQKAQANAANKHNNNHSIDTPKLLELLAQEEEGTDHDPLAQLKHVLLNVSLNIPDPMLIPKDRLSQILSSPAREIPKLLKHRPELRLPEALAYPHLLQDPDILVITLSQLKMIIEKQSQSLPVVEKEKANQERADHRSKEYQESCRTKERVKQTAPEPTMNQQVARKVSALPSPAKEKPTANKEAMKEKEGNKLKKSSELSSDLDAATNAAFSQMMWLPYLNQLEAMNNPDFLKFLTTMLPAGYPPDMSHMMRPFPPPTFPMPQASLNYSPLELSMWQEAMLQARTKHQFDLLGTQKLFAKSPLNTPMNNLPAYTPPFAPQNLPPRAMPPQYQQQQQPPPMAKYPSSKTKTTSSSAATAVASSYHHTPTKAALAAGYHQHHQHHHQQHHHHHPHRESTSHHSYDQHMQRQKQMQHHQQQQQELLKHQQELLKQQEMYQKPKVACKPFANLVQPHLQGFAGLSPSPTTLHQQQLEQYRQFQQLQQQQQHQTEKLNRVSAQGQSAGPGPIDLSGATPCPMPGKLKVKQPEHLVDPKRLLKYDDIAEVGSTTSIDEMHDAQKHLWHPLFGNQKSYTSPWNWTPVTATGE